MMQQALDNHFEIEWKNFRRTTKVKMNAFIWT